MASEQPANGKIQPRLSRGAHAARQGYGTDESLRDHAQVERPTHHHWPRIASSRTESAARFVPSAPVDFSPDDLRQTVEFAAESERGVRVVIPLKFLRKICAEMELSAEREHLKGPGC